MRELLPGVVYQSQAVEQRESGAQQLRRLHCQAVMPDPVGSETAVAQAVIEAYQRVGQAEQRGLLVGEAGIGRRLLCDRRYVPYPGESAAVSGRAGVPGPPHN